MYHKVMSALILALILTGCASKPPKTCYELTLDFTGVHSKQILCTNKNLKESYNFRKIHTD